MNHSCSRLSRQACQSRSVCEVLLSVLQIPNKTVTDMRLSSIREVRVWVGAIHVKAESLTSGGVFRHWKAAARTSTSREESAVLGAMLWLLKDVLMKMSE